MENPTVSVVIPTYNGARTIMDTVHSVAQQSYKNIETIIVIDGSRDGTQDLLECYKAGLPPAEQQRFHIVYQENGGVSAARNTGMKMATGDFIALLDGDDTWHPEKIATQVAAVSKHAGLKPIFCTTNHEVVDTQSGVREVHYNGNSLTLEGLQRHTGAQPGTWLFSKSVLDKIGLFDEKMCVAEDGDFLVRTFTAGGIECVNVDRALTAYNVGNNESLSSCALTPRKLQSFARGFEKHHDLFKERLPADLFDRFVKWHKDVLPADMLKDSLQRIEQGHKAAATSLVAKPSLKR